MYKKNKITEIVEKNTMKNTFAFLIRENNECKVQKKTITNIK